MQDPRTATTETEATLMNWQVGLYVAAVLIPLAAFALQLLGIRVFGRMNAYLATGAIGLSCVLSVCGFLDYFLIEADGVFAEHHAAVIKPDSEVNAPAAPGHAPEKHEEEHGPVVWKASVNWVMLGGLAVAPVGPGMRSQDDLILTLALHIDNLTVIMFVMVTFIATLIHLYSMGYMRDDKRYPLFFAYLSLFCFSMLGLVASANVFMIFIFWELVGVCSYLLIGFWYEEKKNADAANKAFITNRVGDIGMLIGLGLIWTSFGTFSISDINHTIRDAAGALNTTVGPDGDVVTLRDPVTHKELKDDATGRPKQIAFWALTIAGLGIFAGCVGKSAQFPLQVWLPDAMAGPTPVSALIHAATMVAAGVYLVGRFYPLFTPDVLLYIAYTGGITLFIAATIAVVQNDYKKVLAYSTVSQLGFMMLGLGVGGWGAGLFHLITHAFFKALLFLGAGSVYHSVHTYDMPKLGGLRKKMPITALTMLLATCAISGVPFFSGFYSKDGILAAALALSMESPEHVMLFVLPAVGAAITAFYMFRMWLMVFDGTSRSATTVAHDEHAAPAHGHDDHAAHGHGHGHDHGDPVEHAHESEPIMIWPLILLAVPAVAIGWPLLLFPFGGTLGTSVLEQMLTYGAPIPLHEHGAAHWWAMLASVIVASLGIGGAFFFYSAKYKRFEAARWAARFPGVYDFLAHKWYFDELYWATLIRPCLALARSLSSFDKRIVDGIVNSAAGITVVVSKIEGVFDVIAVDRLVNATAQVVYFLGDQGRRLQTGRLRGYLMVLAIGVVGLSAWVFFWIQRS